MQTAEVKDFVKDQKNLYQPPAEPQIIEVPEMTFLMIDGEGAPDPDQGTEGDITDFQHAVGAAYGIAYGIKMSPKKGQEPSGFYNFKVPPLEALWWMRGGGQFDVSKRDDWRWTLMLQVPEFCTPEVVELFANRCIAKKKDEIYKQVRVEQFKEGDCVQLMHVGSYASEAPNIQKMHDFALSQGYKLRGRHHEIYFGDPRRTAPEKLKTVLRQPITR